MLLLLFAVVGDIPRLQLLNAELRFGEGAQLGQLFSPCGRARFARSVRKSSTCCGFSAILVDSDFEA